MGGGAANRSRSFQSEQSDLAAGGQSNTKSSHLNANSLQNQNALLIEENEPQQNISEEIEQEYDLNTLGQVQSQSLEFLRENEAAPHLKSIEIQGRKSNEKVKLVLETMDFDNLGSSQSGALLRDSSNANYELIPGSSNASVRESGNQLGNNGSSGVSKKQQGSQLTLSLDSQ